jgi:arginase
MKITIIQVPYDSGIYYERMGKGPFVLAGKFAGELLSANCGVESKFVYSETLPEIKSAFELQRKVRDAVSGALAELAFPLVISGNCNISQGTLGALNMENTALIWFDAHADCETPQTSETGFLDGMGLAMITGGCWRRMSQSILKNPLQGGNVLLIGTRDLSESETKYIAEQKIKLFSAEALNNNGLCGLEETLRCLKDKGINKAHIHLDLDVFDPSVAPANYAYVKEGLTCEVLKIIISQIQIHFTITSIHLASYDPAFDPENKLGSAAWSVLRGILVMP